MSLIAYVIAGGVLGAMFFGGLWLTVRSALASANPGLWLVVSSVLRMAALLAAFYLICRIEWWGLIAALAGFLLVRVVAARAAAGH
jgi:F1F0 ATPase subunit 2